MPPIWLLSLVARTGIPTRFQRAASWLVMVAFAAIVVALLIGAFHVWLSNQRSDAIEGDRALSAAEANAIEARAEAVASANMVEQVRNDTINEKEVRDEVRKGDASSAGPGVRGVLDRVREQQAAGRR